MNIMSLKRVTVIAAHYDDESLFCGGALLRLRDTERCDIRIAIATDISDTNPGVGDEEKRKALRLGSFAKVVQDLGASAVHLGCKNYRGLPNTAHKVWQSLRQAVETELGDTTPQAVITHDWNGEYGNWMHRLVHYAVRDVWTGPLWTFQTPGCAETVSVSWTDKKRLLEHYRETVVPGQVWEPWNQSAFSPWCVCQESFKRSDL